MRYLAMAFSVLMLAACTSDFQKQGYAAVKADCRLRGFIPGSVEYRDCIKVGNHNVDVVDMQHRLMLMQQYNSIGAIYAPQPAPVQQLPTPTVGNTQTFCYPTDYGYTYCQ